MRCVSQPHQLTRLRARSATRTKRNTPPEQPPTLTPSLRRSEQRQLHRFHQFLGETRVPRVIRLFRSSWARLRFVPRSSRYSLAPVPVLDATKLLKVYAGRPVLRDVTLTLRRGERVGLVGNNGSGKSTLARAAASA